MSHDDPVSISDSIVRGTTSKEIIQMAKTSVQRKSSLPAVLL